MVTYTTSDMTLLQIITFDVPCKRALAYSRASSEDHSGSQQNMLASASILQVFLELMVFRKPEATEFPWKALISLEIFGSLHRTSLRGEFVIDCIRP